MIWFFLFALQGMELLKLGKVTRVAIEVIYIWKNWNYIKFMHENLKYFVFLQNRVLRKNTFLSMWLWNLLVLGLYSTSSWAYWPLLNILKTFWRNPRPNETETLKMTLANLKAKNNCRWSRCMEIGQQVKGMRENVQQATTVRWSKLLMECSWLGKTLNMQCNKRIWSLTKGWRYRH